MLFVLLREVITPRIPLFQPNSLVTVYCFIYAKVFLFFKLPVLYLYFKDWADRFVALLTLILFSLLLFVALLVRWRLGSPVIFRQKRPDFVVGLSGFLVSHHD